MATFRTRARAVDLLGRQQIAGVPTAFHELFKNAHDAYADNVEVDYFREDGLLVIRDDGLGMTLSDFENRWLVLGTESKVPDQSTLAPAPVDASKPRRPVLGEKGIGRLAIGIVGNQVLVLSRAIRDGEPSPLVAAYLHWGVFAVPGINLDAIKVPVRELRTDGTASAQLVSELVTGFCSSLDALLVEYPHANRAIKQIIEDSSTFAVDPEGMEPYLPGEPTLRLVHGNCGTQFWVFPANEVIESDLARPDNSSASRMERQLLGFSDSMAPTAARPVMSTAFRDHHSGTDVRDVIAPAEFFTPGEFLNADHHVSGQVDAFGQFVGTVSVYGEEYAEHAIPFHGRRGKATRCGPFDIHLAVVQGERAKTTLPDQEWAAFSRKTQRIGGVYVYVDGIRVLPYGSPEVDWLEIEERRSKHASYYFFSHRRMCGSVQLHRESNPEIREKAGREGFIQNNAYRDLVDVIQNLLIRLAAEFFRRGSDRGDRFHQRADSLKSRYRAEQKRRQQVRPRRNELASQLEEVFRKAEAGAYADAAARIERDARNQIDGALDRAGENGAYLLDLEARFREEVSALRTSYEVSLPRVGLTKQLDRSWRQYLRLRDDIERRVTQPLQQRLGDLATSALEAAVLDAMWYDRVSEAVLEAIRDARERMAKEGRLLNERFRAAKAQLRDGVRERIETSQRALANVERSLLAIADTIDGPERAAGEMTRLLAAVDLAVSPAAAEFGRIGMQFEAITWDSDADPLEQLVACEDRVESLTERLNDELEAAQLGMTVEILSHEFEHNISDIRSLLRELRTWGRANSELGALASEVTTAFEHLDSYLTLFTPLQRRLYRSKTTFSGGDLEAYLFRLFGQRLEEKRVELVASPAFRSAQIFGYPSTFFPALVNLVDNALWWLDGREGAQIDLTADDRHLYVSDNGPGIGADELDLVFEHRFSLKPDGRGLGLTIARDGLRAAGSDLVALESDAGALFQIRLPARPDDEQQ